MRRAARSLFPIFLAAAAGCVSPPARIADPFAEVEASKSIGQAAYPGLTLAVVYTQNTKNSIAYARDSDAAHMWPNLNLNKPLDALLAQLRANFKLVQKAGSLDDAKGLGTDLIGMVDLSQFFGTLDANFTLDETVAFLDPLGNSLDKVGVHSKKSAPVSDTAIQQMVADAEDENRDSFQTALSRSEALQTYAKEHGGLAAGQGPKTGRSDVDKPVYKLDEDSNKFAVVIGIEDYESIPSADYAQRDARAMRDHLLALGYPERNVIYLTGQRAGKASFEKYLESWLPRNVDENSQVFFYFSGHGAPDVKDGQAYLMPWDADAQFVDATGFPVKRLYEDLNGLKAKRVIVALDSCFSGAGGRSVIAKGARPLVTHVDSFIPDTEKLVILAAASGDEITGTDDDQAHGLFTYYLLKGLNDKRGLASVKTLYDFVKPRVEDAARRDNRDQTPRLLPAGAPSDGRL